MVVHELFEVGLPVVGHRFRFYSHIRKNMRAGMQRVRGEGKKVRKGSSAGQAT
jgi:hypothetical protein